MLIPSSQKLEYPEDALRSKNATQWFPAAFQYLNQDLGQDYAALIESWVTLERCKNWAYSAKGIAAKNRPKELSYWITNYRYNRPGNDPRLQEDDLVRFGKSFLVWWNSLQPQRNLPGEHDVGKEWGSLNMSGRNSWLSIIVCLKWWGMKLGDDRMSSSGDKWRLAVQDVLLTLNDLTSYLSTEN